MMVSTPDRTHPLPPAHREPLASFLLPPLSAMLGAELSSPLRPSLPAAHSFATPQTPRYLFPGGRSASMSALAKLPELAGRSPQAASATTRSVAATSPPTATPAATATAAGQLTPRTALKRKHSSLPSRDFAFISHSPATYPSQEPAIDNASLARRKRRRTSPVELAVLNDEFVLGLTPDKARRGVIAAKVNMTEKAVQIWFQNKRQSLRRLRNADREITELPPTPEYTEARAAAAPPPFYASTPLRAPLHRADTTPLPHTPSAPRLSSARSVSASDLALACLAGPVHAPPSSTGSTASLLSKLATASDEKRDDRRDKRPSASGSELVMNLTNKKQPEFARQSAQVATQVMTFKLMPKDRKPLASLSTNTTPNSRMHSAKDSQCVQGLLSLKVGHH